MKYKVKITKQPKYQTGGEQDDSQKQIMMLIQQYAQKTGVDPQTLVHKLQQLKPEEQQQALQQMQQDLQGEQQPQTDMGYDIQQPEMAHGGRVAHQQQVDSQQQQQLMQLISAYAQIEHVDPKIIMQKLHQLQPQQQQEAIQQMVQSVQQAQQSQPQEQDPQQEGQMQPMAAYGGQMGYGLDISTRKFKTNSNDDEYGINRNIDEVDRSQANIEAEDGETALIPYKGDSYLHKNIVGNKHAEGGVPLKVPEGTFIYSNTKKMKLGGPVLQMFGKAENTTKKYTPADIAKQYNIDKYTAIINNPKSDAIAVRTAELMIQNYEKKLAQLALVQESKKGFPQGIPEVAKDYYQQMQQATQASAPQEAQEQQQGQDVDQDIEQGEQPQAQYGGGLEEYQTGREFKSKNGVDYAPLPVGLYNVNDPSWTQDPDGTTMFYHKQGTPGAGYNVPKGRGGKQDPNSWMYAIDRLAPQGATLEDLKNAGYLSAVNDPKVIQYWNSRYKAVPQSTPDLNYYTEGNRPTMSSIDEDWDANPPGQGQPVNTVDIRGFKTAFALPGVNLPQIPNNKIVSRATVGCNPQTSQSQTFANHNTGAWSTPDKLGMLNSMLNLAGVKKYSPFEPTAKLSKADTYYVDPNRALAANAEQANSAKQAAAMFAGPQSRYSYNDGQFGANAANIIGQYATQNVGLGNQAAQQNAAINNQQMEFDTQRAKRLYDAGVIGEQQYQNAIRQAKEAVLQSYTQGYSNAGTLYNMNATTAENYIINPRTGKLEFNPNGGKERFLSKKSNSSNLLSLKELQDMATTNNIPLKQVMEWYKINSGVNSKTSKVKKTPSNAED